VLLMCTAAGLKAQVTADVSGYISNMQSVMFEKVDGALDS